MRQHNINADDVLIAVAASGTTPFTLACQREAAARGALTIGIANNRGTPILEEAEHPIWLDTGAVPIAGSTRMKAGTAQRIALNLLSSVLMILLGRVYDGLMVDVQAVNQKLVRRSEDMLLQITGRSQDEVREALCAPTAARQARRHALHGCEMADATALLDRCGGQLRAALELMERHGETAA